MRKKLVSVLLSTAMVATMLSGCGNSSQDTATETTTTAATEASAEGDTAKSGDAPVAGVCWYNFADTFISNARQSLINIAEADGAVSVEDADSQNDTATQTNNMNNMFSKDVDYLVLNNINTGAIDEICNQILDQGCYGIFANTDTPSDANFEKNEKLYSVSSVATQSGTIMGEAIVDYWNTNPEADRNGNGKLDYVMLLGIQGHYDTTVRSQNSVQAIVDAGIEVNQVGGDLVCEYARAKAQESVAALLANYSDDIDCIIACNDDMALGAIEALKAGGFFGDTGKYVMVTGVDATAVGCDAVREGTLLVTALNNPITLSKAIYKVMKLTSNGEEVTTDSMGIEGVSVEGRRVWLDYKAITKDNVDEAAYDVNDTQIDY
ncbi:MAG: galactose ABC transporter substrate-binding protein [Lachnospiraceae bacterium]|nr:galactose ABC transporter substrate-binding protein [Lachnospiraceae bacterium]